MNAEIERLTKSINRMEKELDTFDQKRHGSSARQDLVDDIIKLKKKLADKVLSFYKK
jgi:predicted  nucleic acid-binding Zn-ribbon protein